MSCSDMATIFDLTSKPHLVQVTAFAEPAAVPDRKPAIRWKASLGGAVSALACWALFVGAQGLAGHTRQGALDAHAVSLPVSQQSVGQGDADDQLAESMAEQERLKTRNKRLEALVKAMRAQVSEPSLVASSDK